MSNVKYTENVRSMRVHTGGEFGLPVTNKYKLGIINLWFKNNTVDPVTIFWNNQKNNKLDRGYYIDILNKEEEVAFLLEFGEYVKSSQKLS